MSRDIGETQYKLRLVPAIIADSNRDSIYLFDSRSATVKKVYTTRGVVYRKIRPVLDLMEPVMTGYSGETKDYIITKDEFEAITGKRP